MAICWGYSLNAWNNLVNSVRKDVNERTFKVLSAGGFEGVELQVGTGRMKPLGRPAIIGQVYGGAKEFDAYLKELGIKQIIAWDYDASAPAGEENCRGRDATDPAQHEGIVQALVPFVEFLQTVGSKLLCVRPVMSWWKLAPVTEEKLLAAAACWNKVGAMTAKYGVKVLIDVDWFCGDRKSTRLNSSHAT